MTKTRNGTPTCGAARPMPGAAYIVATMSSISVWISGVMASTSSARWCNARSPYLHDRSNHQDVRAAVRRRVEPARHARALVSAEVRLQLAHRVAAEALEHAPPPGRGRPPLRRPRPRRARRRRRCARSRRALLPASSDRPSAAASSASRSASCTPVTRTSSPLVTPPSRPPARLVGRAIARLVRRVVERAPRSRRAPATRDAAPPRRRGRCRRP